MYYYYSGHFSLGDQDSALVWLQGTTEVTADYEIDGELFNMCNAQWWGIGFQDHQWICHAGEDNYGPGFNPPANWATMTLRN